MTKNGFPFRTVFEAISYFDTHNPARAKSVNLLEADRKSNIHAEMFSGEHPIDLWASIGWGIKFTLETRLDAEIFKRRYLGDRAMQEDLSTIAKNLHLPLRDVKYRLKKMMTELETEFIRRELIPPTFIT